MSNFPSDYMIYHLHANSNVTTTIYTNSTYFFAFISSYLVKNSIGVGVDSPILRLAWCEDTWKKIYKIIEKHNSLHKYWIFYADKCHATRIICKENVFHKVI